MKRMLALVLCVLLLSGCAKPGNAGPATGQPVSYPDSPITAVVFHSMINGRGDIPVPEEDLEEIADWFYAFTVGDRTGEAVVPGTGQVRMTLTCADGTTEERSLSTVAVDGVSYYVECPNAPECYVSLINGN